MQRKRSERLLSQQLLAFAIVGTSLRLSACRSTRSPRPTPCLRWFFFSKERIGLWGQRNASQAGLGVQPGCVCVGPTSSLSFSKEMRPERSVFSVQ